MHLKMQDTRAAGNGRANTSCRTGHAARTRENVRRSRACNMIIPTGRHVARARAHSPRGSMVPSSRSQWNPDYRIAETVPHFAGIPLPSTESMLHSRGVDEWRPPLSQGDARDLRGSHLTARGTPPTTTSRTREGYARHIATTGVSDLVRLDDEPDLARDRAAAGAGGPAVPQAADPPSQQGGRARGAPGGGRCAIVACWCPRHGSMRAT